MLIINWSNKKEMDWDKLIAFAALCAWLISSFFLAATAFLQFGMDFRGYYAAAQVIITGGNPYDYRELAPVLQAVTGRIGSNPYYYPPWFAWSMTPFVLLPFQIARGIWLAFNLILWSASIWWLSKLMNWPKTGRNRWLVFLIATVTFAWLTWKFEQVGIVLFALMVGVFGAIKKENWTGSGIFLALLLVKPNITVIPVITIALWLIRNGNWRPVIISCLITITLLVGSTIATPQWYWPIFNSDFGNGLVYGLSSPDQVEFVRINTTLADWLTGLKIDLGWKNAIYVFAVTIGVSSLTIAIYRNKSILQIIMTSLLVNYAITPYALQYDYPPLTLVFFGLNAVSYDSKWEKLLGIAINLFLVSVLFWERPISDGYWIVLGLIGLAILRWGSAFGSLSFHSQSRKTGYS